MEYTAYSFVCDMAWMSLLLIIAQVIRTIVKPLQKLYIPSSVIGGVIGLILGPQVLNVIPWSEQIGSYAYLFICIIFAGLYLGKKEQTKLSTVFRNTGDTFCINMATEFICFGSALVFGWIILTVFFPNVFGEFSLLLPSGYCGGDGYASTIGTALNNLLGRDDCVQIGQTFATLGLLTGLIGGIIFINIMVRKGETQFIKKVDSLPEEYRTGIVPLDKQNSMGNETMNPMSIDPLAWHLALTLLAFILGYTFYNWYKQYLPDIEVPVMCLTMIAGVILQKIINRTRFKDTVDKKVESRIGSMFTDYLVGFGVASISLTVVKSFFVPIIVLCVLGTVWPIIMVLFVGRNLFHNYWFERSIFIFGWCTGVVAIGTTLLRICDPEMKSGTLDDYGTAYSLISVIEVFIVALTPQLAVSMGCPLVGAVELAIGILLLIICARFFTRRRQLQRRER